MFRSILAVSEGGPDAVRSFTLARRVAGIFNGKVDAFHLAAGSAGSGIDLPFWPKNELDVRARTSEDAYKEILASLPGATYTAETTIAPLEALVTMGRVSDVIVLGRPGDDPANVAPDVVKTAIYECARAVMIAPPRPIVGPFHSVIVAWNGTREATRAVEYAMPFLAKADEITILVAGKRPDDVAASYLARNLRRHGLETRIDSIDPGAVSGRERGRALIGYTHKVQADLLVMGAYGGGRLAKFLGVGGATGKVISSSPVPVLLAH
jgi:nucleotide-binding universal stress UspA family protein